MGVYLGPELVINAQGFSIPNKLCFYCGHDVAFPLVYWVGNDEGGQIIALHRDCAQRLSIHLQADAKQ